MLCGLMSKGREQTLLVWSVPALWRGVSGWLGHCDALDPVWPVAAPLILSGDDNWGLLITQTFDLLKRVGILREVYDGVGDVPGVKRAAGRGALDAVGFAVDGDGMCHDDSPLGTRFCVPRFLGDEFPQGG